MSLVEEVSPITQARLAELGVKLDSSSNDELITAMAKLYLECLTGEHVTVDAANFVRRFYHAGALAATTYNSKEAEELVRWSAATLKVCVDVNASDAIIVIARELYLRAIKSARTLDSRLEYIRNLALDLARKLLIKLFRVVAYSIDASDVKDLEIEEGKKEKKGLSFFRVL